MIEENLAPAKNSVATEKAEKPHRAKPRASRPLSPKSAAAPKTTSSASKAKPKAKPKDASKVVPKKSPSDSPTGLKPPKAPKTPKIPPALGPVSATKAPRATKSLTTKSPKTAQAATPVRAKKPGSPVAAALITKPRVRKTPSQALDSLKVAKAARAARAAHVELDEALISKSDLIKAERLAKDHL
ncbi:MAG: hypothetical protein LBT38_00125, partial [Deltaproteobacteria bacterium]|nr:hypothetical protein [Deltaproteobacteria bacterium]